MARGFKTGGRQRGTPNKVTREMRERMLEGETPLDYMMRVMRDESADITRRDWAAQAAAPYLHARLASVEQRGTLAVSHEERVTSLAERLAELDAESSFSGSLLTGPSVNKPAC